MANPVSDWETVDLNSEWEIVDSDWEKVSAPVSARAEQAAKARVIGSAAAVTGPFSGLIQLGSEFVARGLELDDSTLPKAGITDVPGIAGRGIVSAELGVAKSLIGTIDAALNMPIEKVRKVGTPWAPSQFAGMDTELSNKLKEAKRRIQSAQDKFGIQYSGALAWTTRTISEAVPYMANALAAGVVAGPAGAATVGFIVEGDNAAEDAITSIMKSHKLTRSQVLADPELMSQVNTERVVVGSLNAIVEAVQVGKVLKFAKSGKHSLKNFVKLARTKGMKHAGKELKGWSGEVARLSIEEALEEFSQEGVSLSVPAIFRNEYPRKADGSPDWLTIGERLGEAALGGAVAGPVLGGAGRLITGGPALETEQTTPAKPPTPAKAEFPTTEADIDIGEQTTDQGRRPGLDRTMMSMVDEGMSVEDAQTVMRGSQEGGKPIEDITESIETRKKLVEVQNAIEIDENDPASLEAENKMDEPQFSEPGFISQWITSKRILMQRIGADVLTDKLLTAKERMTVIKGTLNKEVNKVTKALRKQATLGDRIASKIMKRQTKPVRRMVDLLDSYERLPEAVVAELTATEVEAFNTLRDMTKWLLDRTNVARRQAGLPLINDLTSYIPHWLDSVANDVIDGTYMYKTGYIARLMKGLPRVIKNRTALHRKIKRKIQNNMEQDLGRLMKGLIAYDLHDMFLTNPQQQVWDELLQLQKDGKIPDSTFNAIASFIDYDILSKQAKLDKAFNAVPGVTTSTELINKVLRPLNREITDPAKFYFGGMRKIMHAAFMPFRPRPATRNLGQRLLNLTFFRARDLLRAQFGKQDKITHPETGKNIKILDYIREQDWYKLTKPEDTLDDASLLSRLTSVGMIGFKKAHVGNRYVSNVEVSALTAYYDWKYRFTESHNQKSKYYKRIVEHSKQTGIPISQLQTQQADMMNDIRDGVQMTQWEYMSHGMPTLFRGQTARGIAAYQSWWMNYFMSHTAEGWKRMVTGRTRVRGDGTGGRLLTKGARYRAIKGMGAIYGMARIAKKTLGIAMLGALWMPDPTNGLPPILNLASIMIKLMTGFDEPEKKKQAWKDLKKNAYRLLPFNNAARDIAKVGDDWTLKDYIFYTENEKWKQLWIPVEKKETTNKKGVSL